MDLAPTSRLVKERTPDSVIIFSMNVLENHPSFAFEGSGFQVVRMIFQEPTFLFRLQNHQDVPAALASATFAGEGGFGKLTVH